MAKSAATLCGFTVMSMVKLEEEGVEPPYRPR
jgi:hypothetical protein